MCFVVLLAYSFIVFILSSPLRPLSRVASDYSSDSVVGIGTLRPLRPLREIKIIVFCFSRKDRRERKVLFTFRIPRLRWSGRKLRYDKSAQSVYPPPPPCGVLPPVSGGETDPSPALHCMGGSSYNRLVPHQQNIILPSIQGEKGL